MKDLLAIFVAVGLAALVAYGIGRATGRDLHSREMLVAAAVVLVAAEAGMIPSLLLRHSSQVTRAQAGLGGSVIHLLLILGLGSAAWVAGLAGDANAFLLWLLPFYWVTLIAMVAAVVRTIRQANAECPDAH